MDSFINRTVAALSNNLMNAPGWSTKRKIIVIESDDWGSIRMPSLEVYEKFLSRGLKVSDTEYNRLDSLESDEDLFLLFELLKSFKNSADVHPVITANVVTGNPDFDRIRNSEFREYFYEHVTVTCSKYPNSQSVTTLWKHGNTEKIFHPQFHGREHVNIARWMKALGEKSPEMMFTFDNETTFSGNGDYNFMEVLDYNSSVDLEMMKESLSEGLDLFEQITGYPSRSFIPPCYTWDSDIEDILNQKGVKYIQGLFVQQIPTGSFGTYKTKYHFTGSRNYHGQYYLVRNCFFEPSLTRKTDPVGDCFRRIKIAFKWHKPAIICSHRINYIGSLDEKNRTKNLELLRDLLGRILKTWPDVEFMTSDQLGDLIAGSGVWWSRA